METSERISLAAIMMIALALLNQPARADGLPPPRQAYPLPPQPSQSCLMTALQLGYLTGSAVLPYGYYGPYVPSGWAPSGWVPPGWALPVPPGYGEGR